MKTPTNSQSECKILVWDTAGAERFRSLSLAFYKRAQGAVICFDLTKSTTFEAVKDWIRQVSENCAEDVVTILVGNKCDLTEDDEL